MSTVNILHLFVVQKLAMELDTFHKLCRALVTLFVCSYTLWLTFNNLHFEHPDFIIIACQTGGTLDLVFCVSAYLWLRARHSTESCSVLHQGLMHVRPYTEICVAMKHKGEIEGKAGKD